jgi:tetratricopeptide (TPR) repeat protein
MESQAIAPPADSAPAPTRVSRWKLALAGLCIAAIIALTYSNSVLVPFYFDDRGAITENASITSLGPSFDEHGLHWDTISPSSEHGSGALGRPLVNLSLAVNYQIAKSLSAEDNKKILALLGQHYEDSQSKDDDHNGLVVWNYHVLNIIFHIIAAWILLGVVRRTLLQPALAPRFAADAFGLAFCTATIWAAHPLLTEVVTCVIQRNESMVSIFYLLALYCFIRSVDTHQARWWRFCAVVACYLGVATKELMFCAPIIILLYDRTFVAGSFRTAWKERRGFYGAMISSWALLGWLMYSANQRNGIVGFNLDMTPWSYALKQCQAIVHYFYLAFWPHPLVMDYGADIITHFGLVWKQAIILAVLVGATIWALWRKPAIGFAGAWIFIILAPSSSIVPLTTQTMAEHRMYLPLVPFVLLVVLGLYRLAGRSSFLPLSALALLLAALSYSRNRDYGAELSSQPYASEVKIWTITAKQVPENDRAHLNLGVALAAANRLPESVQEYRNALRLNPNAADSEFNLALALERLGQTDQALLHYRASLRIKPGYLPSLRALAHLYITSNDLADAIPAYAALVQVDPSSAPAHLDLGKVYLRNQQLAPALAQFQLATSLDPQNTDAWFSWGNALTISGDYPAAMQAYSTLLKIQPGNASARVDVAFCLMQLRRYDEAARAYEDTLRADPANTHAQAGLAEAHRLQAARPPAQNTPVAP